MYNKFAIAKDKAGMRMKEPNKDVIDGAFGSWKTVKDSVAFVRKIRAESEERANIIFTEKRSC